ncbi:MAG: hypothetical protein S4CHLAM81_02970 [Chlamydiales bacterium]|nr:hypothetical protein [Chlamydiales bacterium]MCH9635088.1 hypothetical protein [Chlamydiales bacterium]
MKIRSFLQDSESLKTLDRRLKLFSDCIFSPIALLLRLLRIRVLVIDNGSIGHLSFEPYMYLKHQALENNRVLTILMPYVSILTLFKHIHSGNPIIANKPLFDLWKRDFFTIRNPMLCLLLTPILHHPFLQKDGKIYQTLPLPGYFVDIHYGILTKKFRERFGETALTFKLSSNQQQQGKKLLCNLGLPPNAKYICFYTREPGYKNLSYNPLRNGNILDFKKSLDYLTEQGYFCIRTGDPNTRPLPKSWEKNPMILDYPHLGHSSPFNDLFLLSSCSFFIGCNSGIILTCDLFNVPKILINSIPFGYLPLLPGDRAIFKKMKRASTGEYLPFSEAMRSCTVLEIHNPVIYKAFDIEVIDNTEDEIFDAVKEMLDPPNCKESKVRQEKFRKLYHPLHPFENVPSTVCDSFLKKYEHLL